MPGLTPELMWALVVGELPLESAAALAEEGGIPRPYLGIVARRLVEAGQPIRAQRFLERLFDEPEVLDRSDMDTLDALLEAYEKLNLNEEMRSFVQRFTQGFLQCRGDGVTAYPLVALIVRNRLREIACVAEMGYSIPRCRNRIDPSSPDIWRALPPWRAAAMPARRASIPPWSGS